MISMEFYCRLLAVGLLCFCKLSLSQECERTLRENTSFTGRDITHVFSPDAEHCQLMCTQHPSCLFFTFVRSDLVKDKSEWLHGTEIMLGLGNFKCHLMSSSTGQPLTQTTHQPGVTSGYSLKPCSRGPGPGTNSVCLPKVYENMTLEGGDYRTLFTADYEQCQRHCTQDPGCAYFTFIVSVWWDEDDRYKCHLKFSWDFSWSPKVLVAAEDGKISGFSHKLLDAEQNLSSCQTRMFPNTEIPGQDLVSLPVTAVSPEHCLRMCSAHPLCTYFTYFTHGDKRFHCVLKYNGSTQMTTRANEAAVSVIPTRICQPDNSNWVKAVYQGVDLEGHSLRFVLLDDPEACQRTCTEDPYCQFWTYVTENFSGPGYWRHCYLKRAVGMPAPGRITKQQHAFSGFSLRNCPAAC